MESQLLGPPCQLLKKQTQKVDSLATQVGEIIGRNNEAANAARQGQLRRARPSPLQGVLQHRDDTRRPHIRRISRDFAQRGRAKTSRQGSPSSLISDQAATMHRLTCFPDVTVLVP